MGIRLRDHLSRWPHARRGDQQQRAKYEPDQLLEWHRRRLSGCRRGVPHAARRLRGATRRLGREQRRGAAHDSRAAIDGQRDASADRLSGRPRAGERFDDPAVDDGAHARRWLDDARQRGDVRARRDDRQRSADVELGFKRSRSARPRSRTSPVSARRPRTFCSSTTSTTSARAARRARATFLRRAPAPSAGRSSRRISRERTPAIRPRSPRARSPERRWRRQSRRRP